MNLSLFISKADFLGDRIAIMSKGKLKCCGSPLYLKSKFGAGYNLTIAIKKINDNTQQIDTNEKDLTSKKLIDLVKNFIPNSKLNSNINSEISFILPSNDSDKFSQLFECLEKEKDNLNIVNVGVSVTTIEDVFLK
jgi:ATP-binding cassette subfamily A (ABC1) protein 3